MKHKKGRITLILLTTTIYPHTNAKNAMDFIYPQQIGKRPARNVLGARVQMVHLKIYTKPSKARKEGLPYYIQSEIPTYMHTPALITRAGI
jgi:hypothetical protein